MARTKITMPRILVVEDDPLWRRELSMMYCRILYRTSITKAGDIAACRECSRFKDCLPASRRPQFKDEPIDNLHENVASVADGGEAIRRLRSERNRFHVLSLDLNLASQHAGSVRKGTTGLDVFDEAVKAQRFICVVAVTGVARDSELPKLLTDEENKRVLTLEAELRDRLDGAYLFFNKMSEESYGDAQQQVRQMERHLAKEKLLDLVRMREASQRRREPSTVCLFFRLPDEYFDSDHFRRRDKCVAFDRFSYGYLNGIDLWEDDLFGPDDFDARAAEMLRLLRHFPLAVGRIATDAPARGVQSVQFGTSRLEPRQQQLLIELAIRRFDESEEDSAGASAETRSNVMRRHASALRAFMQTELGFDLNPVASVGGRYHLAVPVSVFLCTEEHLRLALA